MSQVTQPVLIAGEWLHSTGEQFFQAVNPRTKEKLPALYPVSPWTEIESALRAAFDAAEGLRGISPEHISSFLQRYSDRMEARREEIINVTYKETGLPKEPRLNSVELPRTTGQIRKAAEAARDRSWSVPTLDTKSNVHSMFRPIGPVCVFGPNNFPLAFGSASGGDFAAAVAAGNPVIAKANTSHPGATKLLAEEAFQAAIETGMPAATVQLIYRCNHQDGKQLVSHPLLGATGYTGSRSAGLALKSAADAVGKPIYLELSSINPVIVLPGAMREKANQVINEFMTSLLMGSGQFCTNPGLVLLLDSEDSQDFVAQVKRRMESAPVGTLLSEVVEESLFESIGQLKQAGAELVTGGEVGGGEGYSCKNTLLRIGGQEFLANSQALQEEAFGNCCLIVLAESISQLQKVVERIEGNLTGCIYSHSDGQDEALYWRIEPLLRQRVGRLLNDQMPTGVLVTPAMNHGGPYPATGHPGFTAVGIPASMRRFATLQCYDQVRHHRLPVELQDSNPTGRAWRLIDGQWTQRSVSARTE